MTISSTLRRAGPFSGNGVATAFPFSFKVFGKTDVAILLVTATGVLTTLVLDSDYSVALNADQNNSPGGTITYPKTGSPMTAGYSLLMLGDLHISQPTDITNSGGFYPSVIEDMVDRATIQIQQIDADRQLAVHFPNNETTSGELPQAPIRANMLYGFDANGQPEMLPITASIGAGDLHDDIFISSTLPNPHGLPTFTPGVSTSVTLSRPPGTKANITYAAMDAALQTSDTYSLAGQVLTFLDGTGVPTQIPVGVSQVVVKTGTTLSLAIPINGVLPTLSSLNALKVLIDTRYTSVFVTGFANDGTNAGGGEYCLDPNDATSPDNGGSVIRNLLGCWKLKHNGTVSLDVFGADYTGATDAAPQIQAAINWAQENFVTLAGHRNAAYALSSGLTWKHGNNGTTDTKTYSPLFNGNNCRFFPSGNFIALWVQPRCLMADAGTGRGEALIDLRDFTISGAGATAGAQGLQIGTPGYHCSSISWSNVQNVTISAYGAFTGIQLMECRHIAFSRLVHREGPLAITAQTPGSFAGDFTFDTSCEFNGNKTQNALLLLATGGAVGNVSAIGGVKFNGCDMFGSGYKLTALANSAIIDVWFNSGCQWDTAEATLNQRAVDIEAIGSGAQIIDVHFDHCYWNTYKGTLIVASSSGGGFISELFIDSPVPSFNDCTSSDVNAMFFFAGVSAFEFKGGQATRNTGNASTSVIVATNCVNFSIDHFKATNLVSMQHGITLSGANSGYTVDGNIMNVTDATAVNDVSTGSPVRAVNNNLKV